MRNFNYITCSDLTEAEKKSVSFQLASINLSFESPITPVGQDWMLIIYYLHDVGAGHENDNCVHEKLQ